VEAQPRCPGPAVDAVSSSAALPQQGVLPASVLTERFFQQSGCGNSPSAISSAVGSAQIEEFPRLSSASCPSEGHAAPCVDSPDQQHVNNAQVFGEENRSLSERDLAKRPRKVPAGAQTANYSVSVPRLRGAPNTSPLYAPIRQPLPDQQLWRGAQ